MKNIIVARDLLNKDKFTIHSDDGSSVQVEIEEPEFGCEGCSVEAEVNILDFSENFLWHPKKKF